MPSAQPLQITLEIVGTAIPDQRDRQDVDLHDLGPQDYLVRIGGGFLPATLTWDRALLADLAALRSPGGDPEVLQRLGARLRHFLRGTDWPRHEADLLAALARNTPVHVTLSADADELYALPWDLLALDTSGQHIGELSGVLVRYAWPRSRTSMAPAATTSAGAILLAWSAAAGQVPAAAHARGVRHACGRRSPIFDERHDVLAHVSWGRLQDALRAATTRGRPVRVLHILCHGVLRGRSVCLAWNDDDGDGPAIIDGGRLRQLLAEHAPELRLVVLCACDSSHEGVLGTHLGSLARNLHRVGIQTVIGSAVPLSVRGSITFTEHFYRSLVAGKAPPAHAFVAARRRLARHVRTLDWLALRFYARPEDGNGISPLPAMQPDTVRKRFGRGLSLLMALTGACVAALALAPSTALDWTMDETVHQPHLRAQALAARDAGIPGGVDGGPARDIDAGPGTEPEATPALPPGDPARPNARVHRVRIIVPPLREVTEILVDDIPVGHHQTAPTVLAIHVSPGYHRITVRAPRHQPCHQSVVIDRDGQNVTPCAP